MTDTAETMTPRPGQFDGYNQQSFSSRSDAELEEMAYRNPQPFDWMTSAPETNREGARLEMQRRQAALAEKPE